MTRILVWLGILVVCALGAVVSALWMLVCILIGSPRAFSISIGFDHLFNAATGGSPKETVSSRANRARANGRRWGCVLCRLLDHIDPGHCERSAGS